jgi:transcriptional regulator with XRE-family HTH domain
MQLLLQAVRDERGLQQTDVAEVLKRSKTWVSRKENRERPLTLDDLVRFARVYDVHPWDLVQFFRFPPPATWPAPLCAACEARWNAVLAAEEGAGK